MTGKIVRLISDRGFGFIRTEDGKEVFFHHTAVLDGAFDSMSEGVSVEFEMGQDSNSNRERAINVRVVAEQGGDGSVAISNATGDQTQESSVE